jgi:ERCC4-type nuclease
MDARRTEESTASRTTTSEDAPRSVHRIVVDHSECHSALLAAVRRSGWFDVQTDRLATGDYLVNGEVLVERKTIRDLAASLIDGRLFPQVARLAHSRYRSLLLIEDPAPSSRPDVDPHSVEGALVSIAAFGGSRCCIRPIPNNLHACSGSSPSGCTGRNERILR